MVTHGEKEAGPKACPTSRRDALPYGRTSITVAPHQRVTLENAVRSIWDSRQNCNCHDRSSACPQRGGSGDCDRTGSVISQLRRFLPAIRHAASGPRRHSAAAVDRAEPGM